MWFVIFALVASVLLGAGWPVWEYITKGAGK